MAEAPAEFEKIVVDSLKCSICLETFTTPRALACLHTFCEECIQSVISSGKPPQGRRRKVTCPDCRQETDLSAYRGTSIDELAQKLPLNFTIKNIIDGIQDAVVAEGPKEDSNLMRDFRNLDNCDEHTEEKLSLYCARHQAVLCKKCKRRHLMCSLMSIETAAAKLDESGSVLEEVAALESELEETAATLMRNVADLTTKIDSIPETIHILQEEMLAHIARVRATFEGHMEELKEGVTIKQKETIAECVGWLKVLDTVREDLQLVTSHGTEAQRFIAGHQLRRQLENFRAVCRDVSDSVQCVDLRLGLQDILKSVLAISVRELGIETRRYKSDQPGN